MVLELANDRRSRQRVGHVFRTIRDAQRRRSVDVARAMNMPIRTYQAIEAGEGLPEIGDVEAFARATEVDPVALVIAILCGAPSLALACSNNQLMLIAGLELADLIEDLGPLAAKLNPHQVIQAVRKLKDHVREEIRAIEGGDEWLARRLGRATAPDLPADVTAAEP